MAEDSRKSGQSTGGTVSIPGGDGTLFTGLSLRDEQTFAPSEVRAEYDSAGTVNATLYVYDEPDDINAGNESDILDTFHLEPGDRVNPDMVYPDVEDDVVVTTDGNQDGEIVFTIGGHIVTG